MGENNIDLSDLDVSVGVNVTHKPGADLSIHDYPLLVHAPGQHGPGVRTEDNGTPVADIVGKAAEMPDYDQLAEHFKTSRAHVEQAVAYAVAASPKTEE